MINFITIALITFAVSSVGARVSIENTPSIFLLETRHGKQKQSTGSWKSHRDTHQNIAKQRKEKKWRKAKPISEGADNYIPSRFRGK